MAKLNLVAEFHDYGAAHRAFAELLHSVDSGNVSLIAGDNSDHYGAQRDFGILEADTEHWRSVVHSGTTLLAVSAHDHQRSLVHRIICRYAPAAIEEAASSAAAR